MRRLIIIPLPLLVCFAMCAKPTPRDMKCELPQEAPMRLDLGNPEHRRHLSDEALRADDIAVRYADSGNWKVPGQPTNHEAYSRAGYDCKSSLFNTIANNHEVSVEQVGKSIRQGRMRFDVIVLLCFYTFYFWAAYYLAKRVWRRFPLRDGRLTALLCVVGASILLSFAGFMLLETVAFWVEGFRLRRAHGSDSLNVIPWAYVRIPLFIIGLVLFWVAAALRYRSARRDPRVDDLYLSLHISTD
jgi:hypothetical protein